MRREPTEAEKRLWSLLRGNRLGGWSFRRQHPVPPYIVDFACVDAKLIVEADGGQHAESERDHRRDAFLEGRGWRVLRFWNNEVLNNTEGVAVVILEAVGATGGDSPRPPASRVPPSPGDAGRGA
jgi:primosomal protein N' (replication factor Y)